MASGGSAEIRRELGGEERLFRFTVGPVRKVQEATGFGPLALAAKFRLSASVLQAMAARDYAALASMDLRQVGEKIEQREVILQALLAGGELAGPDVARLVRDWVDERPQIETLALCVDICMAAVLGNEDEPLGESRGEASPKSPSPTAVSASASSTAPASPPASPRAKSTNSRSGRSPTASTAGGASMPLSPHG